MSGPPPASRLTFATVAAPLLERLGLLFTVTVVTALATSAVVLLQPQKYAATLVMTSVSGPRNSTLGQAFPAALLGNLGAGLQATPALITRLTTSRVVLGRVALEPLDSTDPTPAAHQHHMAEQVPLHQQGVKARDVPLRLDPPQKGHLLDGRVFVSHRVFDRASTLAVGQGTR